MQHIYEDHGNAEAPFYSYYRQLCFGKPTNELWRQNEVDPNIR
jgi:hypothetical protein